ncbi:MAG: hypothetical protein KME08_00970 [Aphanothece sp. CMT-3BRIN-NPC111]|jgi:uncharacterized membrane protein (DUF485 family)|nr:hypothetical protein [Aphanothece sp. CMT-3BRIN-NPC111]
MPINLEIFQKNLTYEITATVEQIWEDLNKIVAIDRNAESQQAKFGKLLTIFIVGAVVSILLAFASLFLPTTADGSITSLAVAIFILGLVVGGGFIVAAIYAGMRQGRYSRLNLPDYRHELLKKVLEMLKRDMEDDANVSVRLVLSPSNQKNKLIKTVPHRYQSGFQVDIFRDEWLNVTGQFLDKSHFILSTTELSQTKHGWKRSRSGKSKYKSKSKSQGALISLTLKYPTNRYGAVKILKDEVMGAVKLPEASEIKRLRLTDKSINLTVKISPSNSENEDNLYQTITMMLLSIYQVLNLGRILSKKKEA